MEADHLHNSAQPALDQPLFTVRCGYKDCRQVSDPQPTAKALKEWLSEYRWKHVQGKICCPLCVLAQRPNQGSWADPWVPRRAA